METNNNDSQEKKEPDSTDQTKAQEEKTAEEKEKDKKKLMIGGAALIVLLGLAALLIFSKGCDKKDKKKDAMVSVDEFSYDLWPFVNRETDMSILMPKLKKIEKELSEKIKALPSDKKVFIYGHTSREKRKQNSKKEKGNIILSTKRAEAVAEYLSKKYGIDKEKFEIKGLGSEELEVKKPTFAPRNRRVIITTE